MQADDGLIPCFRGLVGERDFVMNDVRCEAL